jgi:uncharacterized protein
MPLDLTAFEELNHPVTVQAAEARLALVAGPHTDLFRPPSGDPPTLDAPALLTRPHDGAFLLSAFVEADLEATFDAGALVVWHDETTWAKLAVERSPAGQPTIVSVVTRDRSDDCNSAILTDAVAHLRVARMGEAFAFHVESAGTWHLIRHFALTAHRVRVGFLAQSPTGEGCTARFRDIRLETRRLGDVRDGT